MKQAVKSLPGDTCELKVCRTSCFGSAPDIADVHRNVTHVNIEKGCLLTTH